MSDLLVVKVKVKEAVSEFNVASGFVEKLNGIVAAELAKATVRASLNGRRTLMARDL